MKKFVLSFLAIMVCFSLMACGMDQGSILPGGDISATEAPVTEPAETTPPTEETLPMVEVINMTTENGTITYDGFEAANSGLVDDDNAVIFKFTFTSNSERPIQCQDAFQIKYYQNGVEIDECSWTSSKGGSHYELCSNYFLELMKGGVNSFARVLSLKNGSPVTLMVLESGNSDNFQMMEIDVSSLGFAAAEGTDADTGATPSDTPAVSNGLTGAKGSLQYVSCEPANDGLVDADLAYVFTFTFTSNQAMPSQSQSVFKIKFYQNGVEVETAGWTSSKGGDQFELCSNYFQEVLKGGVNTFGRPVELKDTSPVTIIIEEYDNPDNYWSTEVVLG